MKVGQYSKFFNGEYFDDGKLFDFHETVHASRLDLIEQIIEGKNVIHLGATDHLELIDAKIDKGVWLHKIISDSANYCLGVDINSESVKHCVDIGWDNIACLDMIEDREKIFSIMEKQLGDTCWDYIVAGEIIEHVMNPIDFLSKINELYTGKIQRIIITVPNAFRSANIKFALKGIEGINTDHKYWFTPYTICKVASLAGMIPEEIFYAGEASGTPKILLKFFRKNICAEDIILIASLKIH